MTIHQQRLLWFLGLTVFFPPAGIAYGAWLICAYAVLTIQKLQTSPRARRTALWTLFVLYSPVTVPAWIVWRLLKLRKKPPVALPPEPEALPPPEPTRQDLLEQAKRQLDEVRAFAQQIEDETERDVLIAEAEYEFRKRVREITKSAKMYPNEMDSENLPTTDDCRSHPEDDHGSGVDPEEEAGSEAGARRHPGRRP
jgi:hypothetical protein